MTKDEALGVCLEYIETNSLARRHVRWAIKEALAQPEGRTWVGLTDKEAFQICVDCGCLSEDWLTLLDAIEAKLKEKNA